MTVINKELFINKKVYQDNKIENQTYECVIDHIGDEKYVILELTPYVTTDSEGKPLKYLEKRYVLASTDTEAYHSGQKQWYVENTKELHKKKWRSPECLGGGIMTIDQNNKSIKTFGTSYGYGDPPIEILKSILNTVYPNYNLDITITSEVRELVKPKHNGY
ncbi:hypothetical protein DDB_G0277367 [Dictyostelium discoideum AX4]|uniref:Uncharacterized protein n=1 Tax=Dictyostelium discoideum TaxID=44689 RepID=Q76P10_DICDI|nr:hypothetical protein DDB_G0277367 [Dictyostelium discoideum AX4]EAL68870.1 hypothetical protein DDB_G0277367 [Dictyostelium discoideum AX4]|eukprot:XP_642784.1 hypothetical protein DDB_G0277367 [Dictyostelium discoideum AX4]